MCFIFAGNKKFESDETITLLNVILDGIIDPTNTALRDFSGQCIKEFLKWSIKQTPKKVRHRRGPIASQFPKHWKA